MSFATKKITDLTTLSVSTPSIEFVINGGGTDYKVLNSGLRLTSDQISDLVMTNYATSPNTHTLDGLSDVVITAAATGDIVYYDGSNWVDLARGASDQVLTASTTSIVWSASQGGLSNHNLLSASHPDTVSQSVATGDIMYGGASASWDALSIGGTNAALIVASGLPAWSTTLTSFFATGFTYAIDIITGRTLLSTPQVTTDLILVYDGSAASLVKTTLSVLTFTSNQISDYSGAAFAASVHTHTSAGISDLPWQINGTQVTSVVAAQGLNLNANYIFTGGATGLIINAASNTISNIGFGEVVTDIITGQTTQSSLETTTDYVLVFDGSAGTLVKSAVTNVAGAAGAATATYEIPIVMEVPNDTVCFPDIQSLATSADKMSGFILPDGAATASFNWKTAQAIPLNLASTSPVVRVFVQPLVSTASALAAFVVKSIAVSTTETYNAALTAETTSIVSIPATTYIVAYYEQTLTGIPTAGDHVKGILLRDPTNASDNATSLMVTAMSLLVQRTI